MDESKDDRRKYSRYDSELEVYFRTNYDIKTKVKFWIFKRRNLGQEPKYTAFSKNISAEGMCFYSEHQLKKNEQLSLEVYIPRQKEPILMVGEVKWSEPFSEEDRKAGRFYTGIKLLKVYNKTVAHTIYFDPTYQVVWSIVLESVFGSFRQIAQKKTLD